MKINTKCCSHIMTGMALFSGLMLFTGALLLPREAAAATISCSSGVSGCHFTPTVKDGTARNVPAGRFLGSHARHSGYSTGAMRQYLFACTKCHPSAGYNNSHQSGFKNITGSSLPGNRYSAGKNIANTNTPNFGNCSNSYCHSSGRATGMGQLQYSSVRWGGTKTCLGCHGGRTVAGAPARSVGNFTLTTTHSQHLKYPAANINCQICHAKTATNQTTLKNFTGVQKHVNGVSNVVFTDIAYASYTSYKTVTKKCSNTSCHGGSSKGVWSPTAQNTDHTCTHCHGTTGTSAATANSGYSRRFFAPGWNRQGTSTDQTASSNNIRVGSHFKHLTSLYMRNIKCNECHMVPETPFGGGNHTLNTLRFNSNTLTFAQSSTAMWNGVTLSKLPVFTGYTNGTASKAATCSSVYCHGSRLKHGDTAGTYRKPYWNYSAMINYTDAATIVCARCHGYPPTYSGHSGSTVCSGCHSNISAANNKTIINKALHINGIVEASGGHPFPYPGASHMVAAGTTPWSTCVTGGCHTNTGATGYPVTRPAAPDCQGCHKYNGVGGLKTPSGTESCYDCHGSTAAASGAKPDGSIAAANFPNFSGSHSVHITKAAMTCTNCHFGYGTGSVKHGFSGTSSASRTNFKKVAFNGVAGPPVWVKATTTCNNTCHGSGVWGGRLKCIDCHDSTTLVRTKAGNYTMANVVAEFKSPSTWGHTKTKGFTVTDADCIVCHLEGSMATLSKTALHADGYIDLRDHAVATNDVAIKDLAGAAITFKRFTTTFAAGSRSSTVVNTSVRDVVTRKFCLGCHKSGGSSNTTAGQGGIAAGGSATKPFGSAGGTVLNINSQFATSNASKHPVLGPLNKDYPTQARLVAPYNGFTRTGGTKSNGVIINCFDCHNVTGTPLTHRTVSAHGNAVTIRGVITGAAPTFCTKCHSGYTGVAAGHGTNSAFATVDNHMDNSICDICVNCHASKVAAARPIRGEDVHGVNVLPTGTQTKAKRWAIGGAVPISFIRNNDTMANHQPKNIGGTTSWGGASGQQCDMNGCASRTGCVYSPGGTY